MNLSDHDREILAGRPRHEQARMLLRGQCGPLVALPQEPEVAAAAYLVYLAWIRARVPGHLLSGRPGYEAWETMRSRVQTAGRRSGSLRDWAHDLFRRLRLSLSGLTAEDAVWWTEASRAHAGRWRHMSTDLVLTEVVTAARLLDELLHDLKTNPEAEEAVDVQQ